MNIHRRSSNSVGRKDGENVGDRTNRRRITQVDPNIQISEIVSLPTRTHVNRKKLNRSELYHFECEGDLKVSGSDDKLHVKWDAKFDRPIEQLIYPSLQRFDNEAFEKKRQQYRSLHGGSNDFIAHVPRNIGEPGHIPDHYNEGLQLDFIKGGDLVQDNILFLYPPKWNVQLERQQSPKDDTSVVPSLSPEKSVSESDVLSDGGSVSDLRSRRSGRSLRSRVTYQEDVEEEDTISYIPLAASKKYSSLAEEIDTEGERYLRKKIRENFRKKLENDERMLREQAEQKNPFNIAILKAKAAIPANLPPIQDTGDKLVRFKSFRVCGVVISFCIISTHH